MFVQDEEDQLPPLENDYSPVISITKTKLLCLPCIELSQVASASISILLQVGSACSFIVSLYTFKRSSSTAFLAYLNYMLAVNGPTITVYYALTCWALVPLWQNIRFIHNSRIPDPNDIINNDSNLPLTALNDPEDDDAMSARLVEDGNGFRGSSSIIRHTDIDGILTKTKKRPTGFLCCLCVGACCEFCCLCRYSMLYKKERHVTRYIPFSLYNDVYCLLHPGYRMNPRLPDDMERFGVGRGMLFVLAVNAKGTFHMYLFIFAFVTLAAKYRNVDTNDDGDMVSVTFAVFSLLCAAIKLRVFVLSTLFGILLLPMNIGWYAALVCYDVCHVISPNKNTYFYKVLRKFWELLSD